MIEHTKYLTKHQLSMKHSLGNSILKELGVIWLYLAISSVQFSHSVVSDSLRPHAWTVACLAFHPWHFPVKNIRVHYSFLLQGTFPTKGSNPGLPPCRSILYQIFSTQESNQSLLHCRWILYQLSYQGSPC